MNSADIFLIVFCCFGGLCVLYVMAKSRHFFRSLLLSCVSGIGGLFLVNILSAVTGVSLGINAASLAFSALSGLSGVIALLVARLL